jgi:post-segregation antitoxin (ccd killing protein)
MWIYQKWNLTAKCAVTAAVAAVLIIAVATSSSPTTPAINLPPAHVKAAVPLTPEQKHQAALLAKVRAKDAAAAAARQKSIDAAAAKNAALQAAAAQRQQAEQNKQEHAKEVRQAEWAATHIQRNGLTLDLKSVSWFSDGEGSDYITGKITNDSGTDLNYVEVTYKLTDAQGSQVGVAMDNTNDLSAGATWKFKCYVADENATHCQLDDLTDTPL